MTQHSDFLDWRHIEPGTECRSCAGSGVQTYGSTATWRGGIGGAAMTTDVCDHCWGSGKQDRPWPSHRRLLNVKDDWLDVTQLKLAAATVFRTYWWLYVAFAVLLVASQPPFEQLWRLVFFMSAATLSIIYDVKERLDECALADEL